MVDWDAVKAFKKSVLDPTDPHAMGPVEQSETYFQHREASNLDYDATPDIFKKYMDMVNAKIGTDYKPFNYYGSPDATEVLVAMGSVCDAAEELIDHMVAAGRKVGIIEVHLYRPFSTKYLLEVMPKTVQKIAVLDRTKEPGAIGEPLYLDMVAALRGTEFEKCEKRAFGADADGQVPLTRNLHAFRVAVRREMFRRIELMARDDVEGLGRLDAPSGWGEDCWDAALTRYWDEYDWIGTDTAARAVSLAPLDESPDAVALAAAGVSERLIEALEAGGRRVWLATQVVEDPDGDHDWRLTALVDLAECDAAERAVVHLLNVGPRS